MRSFTTVVLIGAAIYEIMDLKSLIRDVTGKRPASLNEWTRNTTATFKITFRLSAQPIAG